MTATITYTNDLTAPSLVRRAGFRTQPLATRPRLVCCAVLVGVGVVAGVVGFLITLLLRAIQHAAVGDTESSFLLGRAPPGVGRDRRLAGHPRPSDERQQRVVIAAGRVRDWRRSTTCPRRCAVHRRSAAASS